MWRLQGCGAIAAICIDEIDQPSNECIIDMLNHEILPANDNKMYETDKKENFNKLSIVRQRSERFHNSVGELEEEFKRVDVPLINVQSQESLEEVMQNTRLADVSGSFATGIHGTKTTSSLAVSVGGDTTSSQTESTSSSSNVRDGPSHRKETSQQIKSDLNAIHQSSGRVSNQSTAFVGSISAPSRGTSRESMRSHGSVSSRVSTLNTTQNRDGHSINARKHHAGRPKVKEVASRKQSKPNDPKRQTKGVQSSHERHDSSRCSDKAIPPGRSHNTERRGSHHSRKAVAARTHKWNEHHPLTGRTSYAGNHTVPRTSRGRKEGHNKVEVNAVSRGTSRERKDCHHEVGETKVGSCRSRDHKEIHHKVRESEKGSRRSRDHEEIHHKVRKSEEGSRKSRDGGEIHHTVASHKEKESNLNIHRDGAATASNHKPIQIITSHHGARNWLKPPHVAIEKVPERYPSHDIDLTSRTGQYKDFGNIHGANHAHIPTNTSDRGELTGNPTSHIINKQGEICLCILFFL